jgi:hypothetical protein
MGSASRCAADSHRWPRTVISGAKWGHAADGEYVSGGMVHNTTSLAESIGIDGVSTMVYRKGNVRNFPVRYGTGMDGGGNF